MLPSVTIGSGLIRSAAATGRMARGAAIAVAIASCTLACAESRGATSSTEPLTMRVEAFLVRGNLRITVLAKPSIFPATQTDLTLVGADSKGSFLQERLTPDPVKGTAEIRIDKARIPPGKISLEATAANRQTGRKHQVKKELVDPLQPAWLGTAAGVSDRVPAPWTPLEVDEDTVKPWGRAYRFDRSPLPAGVLTRDARILAGPIRLVCRAGGHSVECRGDWIRYTSRKPAVVSLATRGSSGNLAFEGTAAVEYDGMVRVDLRLIPNQSPLVIDQLVLEIPIKPEHARYLYHFPGQWGSVANSGYLPAGGWAQAFKPFVWLGDEDRGLAWFCESDRGWHPADPNRAITIDRQKNETILRCHLIDRPMPVKGPLEYTFGLQATPVKNPEKTVWDYRITHHGGYGLESQPATLGGEGAIVYLQWLAEMGVRTICFHEHWSPYQSHPYATEENRPRLRSLIEACHRAKVGLLLYMSRQLADNAPEWELRSAEALQVPNMGIYERQPTQKAYYVCWNSPWKDFCLHHLDRLLAEFGHDGWYLDGPEWPLACTNREHGCGYVAPDGSVRPTYDIFATRDFMKRLYVLTRQRKPEGQLNIHNSTVMVIPTLGWGTSSWGGEQLDAIKPPVKTLEILPLDAFRTEFMGRQWGVPSEFLVYDGAPYFARDLLAYTLLHGVLIRPSSNEQIINTAALWKVYDAFPFKDAKLYPYWNNSNLLTCSPKGVYATAYERPGEGLLLFVSNLGERRAEASITVRADRLGWKGPIRSWDALTNKPMEIREGAIRLPLDTWRYRVLRLKPAPAGTSQSIGEQVSQSGCLR